MGATPRKLVVDKLDYRWARRRSRHVCDRELVSVWAEGHRRAILQVEFSPSRDRDHRQYLDMANGWIGADLRVYNLNRPAMVAALIADAHTCGWDPLGQHPRTVDGFARVRARPAAFPHEPIAEPWWELALELLEAVAPAAEQGPIAWLRDRSLDWPTLIGRNSPAGAASQPEWVPALTLAGLLEFDVLLLDREALDPAQIAELLIQADARQTQGRAGGLVLTSWLLGGPD